MTVAWLGAGPGSLVRGQSTHSEVPELGPPIAQHGGSTVVIAPDPERQRLWIGQGPRVVAIGVADPTDPRVLLRGPLLDDLVGDIVVEGDRLVVAAGSSIHVLGIGEDGLALLGSLDLADSIWRIAGREGIVYAKLYGAGPELVALDTRDPNRIERVPQELIEDGERVTDLLVRGPRLYLSTASDLFATVGERGAALQVFDIQEPQRPVRLARLEDEAWALLAARAGTGATSHGGRGIQESQESQEIYGYGQGAVAMDLSDPGQPRTLQRWPQAPEQRRIIYPNPRLVVDASGHPFVFKPPTFGNAAIWTPDPGDPAGQWLGLASFKGYPAGGFTAFGERLAFAESGGRISVLRPSPEGMTAGPVSITTLDLIGSVISVAYDPSEPDLLVVATQTGGLGSLGLTPGGSVEQLGFAYDGHYHRGLLVSDRIAALQDRGETDVSYNEWQLYDLRDPRRPRPAARTGYAGALFRAFARHGSTLYLADRRSFPPPMQDIEILDISDPDVARSLTVWSVAGELGSFDVDAERLVIARVAWQDDGQPLHPLWLDVVDVSRPDSPRLLRSIDTGMLDEAWNAYPRVGVFGRHAYLMTADWRTPESGDEVVGQLHVFDLEGQAGVPIASLTFEDGAMGIAGFAEGFLFTETLVIDIGDPADPRIVAKDPRGAVTAIDPVRGRLFARDANLGLWVYEPQLDWQLEPAPPTFTAAPTVTPSPSPTPTLTPTQRSTRPPRRSPTPSPPAPLLLPHLLHSP